MKLLSLAFILGLSSFLAYKTVKQESSSPLISHRVLPSQGRSFAADGSSKCMRDLYTVENLKKEITELEESLDTNRITGSWKHIDLSTLPTPAALFLKNYADKLGDANAPVTFEGCADVPCLYNTLYATPDGIAGLVHYLWYLRTGTYLAADNSVPGQQSPSPGQYNGTSFTLNEYLFDEDELYGFWRLGKMLRAPHATLTYLKEVQRVPRGERMEGRMASACGLSHSDGWITLTDQCLEVYRRSDSGYFFPAVIHEINHQVDFEDGKRFNDELYRSHRQDFLSLSGFELKEYRDSSGAIVRQWMLKPGSRLVTAYAQGSPQENFAELLSYYRVEGDKTVTKVEKDSYDFAGAYYQNKKFESQSIADAWVQSAVSGRVKDVIRTVITCADPECLSRELTLIAEAEVGRIRSEEVDGCSVLSNPLIGQTLPLKIQEGLKSAADEFSAESTPEIREKLAASFDDFMKPAAAYESFFACHFSGQECYDQELKNRKKMELDAFGDFSDRMLGVYEWAWPFDGVQKEVTTFYQSLLSSREGVMKKKADELWDSCKAIPQSDSQPPQGTDYIVKDGYMMSSFYNCLNRGFVSMVNSSLDAVKLREFSPKNTQERSFITGLLRTRMTSIVDDKLRSGRATEIRYRDAFVQQQSAWHYNTMRSNRWWVPRGRVDQATLESACKAAGVQLIGGDIFFHLKKDLYKDLLEKTCKGIR